MTSILNKMTLKRTFFSPATRPSHQPQGCCCRHYREIFRWIVNTFRRPVGILQPLWLSIVRRFLWGASYRQSLSWIDEETYPCKVICVRPSGLCQMKKALLSRQADMFSNSWKTHRASAELMTIGCKTTFQVFV